MTMRQRTKGILLALCCLACATMQAQENIWQTEEPVRQAQEPSEQTQEPIVPQMVKKKAPRLSALKVDWSRGWITTKVYTPKGTYRGTRGSGFEVSYRHLTSSYGFSIDYNHSETTFPVSALENATLRLNHYDFMLLCGGQIGKTVIATASAGIGMAHSYDGHNNKAGLSSKVQLNLEIRANRWIGFGASVSHTTATFGKMDFYSDVIDGFKRVALNFGLRIYM